MHARRVQRALIKKGWSQKVKEPDDCERAECGGRHAAISARANIIIGPAASTRRKTTTAKRRNAFGGASQKRKQAQRAEENNTLLIALCSR